VCPAASRVLTVWRRQRVIGGCGWTTPSSHITPILRDLGSLIDGFQGISTSDGSIRDGCGSRATYIVM